MTKILDHINWYIGESLSEATITEKSIPDKIWKQKLPIQNGDVIKNRTFSILNTFV